MLVNPGLGMLNQLHFIEPRWFLMLIPLAIVLWLNIRLNKPDNPWGKIVDKNLQTLLIQRKSRNKNRFAAGLLTTGWLLTVIALANPAWEKQPQPLFQSNAARVIVLDLSMSMNARDLKPSRIQRARFKVADLLEIDNEGQTGLVVFAGDAFNVSPLTHDTDTIQSLLKVLDPSMLPTQGSNVYLGLLKAQELMQDAGFAKGEVILISDGVAGSRAEKSARKLRLSGFTVSVLGVGTVAGGNVLQTDGQPYKNAHGIVVNARLHPDKLKAVATAGGGKYTEITADSADINLLLQRSSFNDTEKTENTELTSDEWKSEGPFFVLILLPLAALAFRRGWLLCIFFMVGSLSPTSDALAFTWNDLWQRDDQQASQALQNEEYDAVEKLSTSPAQLGAAAFRKDAYENALKHFSAGTSADEVYNKGNALAKLGQYEEAIEAYDQALAKSPAMEDAAFNKTALKKLQEQKKEQQESSSDSDKSSQEKEDKEESEQDSGNNNSDEKGDESEKDTNSDEAKPSDNQFSDANEAIDKKPQEGTQEEKEKTASEESNPEQQEQKTQQAPQEQQGEPAQAEQLTSEEQLAAEQWLRRIPDDPGGLLRRKFYYQYSRRTDKMSRDTAKPW